MDSRPTKRQRRLVVSSSDNELESDAEGDNALLSLSNEPKSPAGSVKSTSVASSNPQTTSSSKPLSLRSSRPKSPQHIPRRTVTNRRAPSSSASPDKRRYGNPPSSDTTATKSLHSFFQPATEEQRWSSQKFGAKRSLDPVQEKVDDSDDLIEDDYDSYDEIFTKHFADKKTSVLNDSKPPQTRRTPLSRTSSMNSDSSRKLSNPKAFLLPSSSNYGTRGRLSHAEEVNQEDRRPWAQRFPPSSLDELAVHKKKVADVRSWLENVFTGRDRRRLLVLRGPAGCGKTSTISLLSKALGFDILEWKNPSASDFTQRGYTSVGAQFDEFLGRSHEFGGLDLDTTVDTAEGKGNLDPSQRRILLIEEFPTIMSRNSTSLTAFRSAFQQYLAASAAEQMSSPIVIIVSETLLDSASSVLDNLTVHRLLGPELYHHPGTTIIDFNSIAPTFMNKALKLVLEKESRQSKRAKVPGPAVLQRINEIGDIRSAISSLEFLCLKGDDTRVRGGNLTTKAKKSSRDNAVLTRMEKESLKMITQREASLGIFHAVGKIVYNKRDDPSLTTEDVQLPPPPDHLSHHSRPKVSQVSVNDLVDETGTDIQTFICALHENYAPSCNGSAFTDCVNGCIDALSDSDILCTERKGPQGSRTGARINTANFNAGVDRLRQHEISYQVAARGLLFALPHPVKRSLRATIGRSHPGDTHKMLYPRSIKLWHETEEIDGLINLWSTRLLSPSSRQSSQSRPYSNIRSRGGKPSRLGSGNTSHKIRGDSNDMGAMPVTMLSREDMLLYQLPYMTKVVRNGVDSKGLERITGFQGIAPRDDADNPDESDDFLLDSRLDVPDFPLSVKSRRPKHYNNGNSKPQIPALAEDTQEKLILSDDDIEDD